MVDQVYRWKRFWCPRSGHISLRDRGYLSDPESEWGHHFNPDLVSFETIAELPCLALLGEPGIGKTHAIQVELNTLTEKIQKKGHQILELDLRSYSSEDRLIRKLFESQTFTDWANGTHHLHIFLDSLDECLLRIDTLTTLLIDEFKEYRDKLTRLYLRIACRTAIFPSVLEKGLEQLWGQNSVGVYELAPLRRVDVIETANAQGLDSDAFLEEVNRKSVVAFAIKPITLRFLLNTYRRNDRKFPPNQRLSELYLEGCRSLCEEPNSNRRSSKLISSEAEQRLIVASRIAAVTVFANRYAIWTELDQGDVPDEDVLLRGLCWGHESANGREFQVSEAIVKETLDTGLFSSRGSNRMGWVHQTYAEFLAAWYLKEHSLKLSQMMNLIVHPNDPDRRIVPQLHETTAWLAGMVPRVFKEVMKTDPDVLLQSDIATVSEVDKAALVESLLKLHNQEKLAYQPSFGLYENLNHSELPEQLHPYISDSTKSISSRYVAIDIAETCNVQAVQASLADVALDPEQPYWVRMHAAKVVCYIGSEKTKARLKPLAIGEAGDDPEDELKGYGLRATYPSHMTAEEVFDTLIQPRKKAFGGSYQDFLANDLGCHLKLADLRVALGWLEKRPTRRELNYPFDHLSNAIMLKAWEYLEEPGILDAFAKIASSRLRKHDKIVDDRRNSLFKQELESNDSKRRQLIEAIITSLPASEQNPMWLGGYSVHGTKIVLEQDFLWMIERLQESNSEQVQKIYTKLIYRKLDWNNPDRVSAVITASQSNLVLREEFLSELEPIELGSSKAENARSRYLEIEEMRNSDEDENQSLLEPPPKERVLIALNHFESGQIDSWWYLCREMMLLPTSTHYDESFESDITVFPGWEDAEAETRTRIIAAAKVYIYQGEPETDSWLGTNSFNYSALSGYKALRLILVKDPDFISTISADIWKRWASIILAYPNAGEEKVKENRQQLIRKAYQNAPDEFIRTLLVLIDTENQQFSSIHINSQVRHCWDERLATALFDKAKDKALTASSLGSLLEDLLAHQVYQARVFAESLIPLPPPSVDEEKAKAVVAAQMLILYAEDAGWSVVWSAVQQYPEFGREVVESLSLVAALID